MNKSELVAAVAAKTGFTKKDTEITVNEALNAIEAELKKGSSSGSEHLKLSPARPVRAETRRSRAKW